MLVDSNLLHELEQNALSPTGEPMCVFGDPAYPFVRVHLQAPFRHGILTPMMEGYDAEMSSVRVTVEWLFGDIINDFKFLDFKKNLKIGMSSVGKMYLVCALLHNAISCLYGNSTSEFLGPNPLSLQDYFRWIKCIEWIYFSESKHRYCVSWFNRQWLIIKRPKSYWKLLQMRNLNTTKHNWLPSNEQFVFKFLQHMI